MKGLQWSAKKFLVVVVELFLALEAFLPFTLISVFTQVGRELHDLHDLLNLSLVSKRFSSVAIPLLWQKITVPFFVPRTLIMALLETRKVSDYTPTGLGGFIRILEMSSSLADSPETRTQQSATSIEDSLQTLSSKAMGWIILSHATDLRQLNLNSDILRVSDSIANSYPRPSSWENLSHLTLTSGHTYKFDEVMKLVVTRFPDVSCLRRLDIQLVTWGGVERLSDWEPSLLGRFKEFVSEVDTLGIWCGTRGSEAGKRAKEFIELVEPRTLHLKTRDREFGQELFNSTSFKTLILSENLGYIRPLVPRDTNIVEIVFDCHTFSHDHYELAFLQSIAAAPSVKSVSFIDAFSSTSSSRLLRLLSEAVCNGDLSFSSDFTFKLSSKIIGWTVNYAEPIDCVSLFESESLRFVVAESGQAVSNVYRVSHSFRESIIEGRRHVLAQLKSIQTFSNLYN